MMESYPTSDDAVSPFQNEDDELINPCSRDHKAYIHLKCFKHMIMVGDHSKGIRCPLCRELIQFEKGEGFRIERVVMGAEDS